jgi:hypothetical protein
MDDLDLIRRFAQDDGEPDAGARDRVGARVERGIEARTAAAAPSARRRRRLRRLTIAAAAAAVLIVAASFGAAQLLRPSSAQASVQFAQDDGYIVATVRDPFAAEQQLRAAFAAHGLDIDLRLVPVSPSIVGSVVYLDGNGIETLLGTRYDGPKGEQPVGLRIPADFKGHASIVLGRPAKPGETYVSAGDAFAPGEALDGVDLVGMTVADAARLLQRMGLAVSWRVDVPASDGSGAPVPTATPVVKATPTAAPTPGSSASAVAVAAEGSSMSLALDDAGIHKYDEYFVTGAVPKADGSVYVFAAAKPATQK